MPLIFNIDGTKMSKRDKAKVARQAAKQAGLKSVPGVDDAVFAQFLDKKNDDVAIAVAVAAKLGLKLPEIDVHDFRVNGYLPEVICNYISLLGWSPGGDIEKFDNTWLAAHFTLEGIGKSNAKFDRDKLFRFNGDAIQALAPEEFVRRWRGYCEVYEPAYLKLSDEHFAKLAAAYKPRARTLKEPCDLGRFFILADDAITFDEKSVEKVLRKDGGFDVLRDLRPKLAALSPWSAVTIEGLVKTHAETTGLGLGKVAQPIRVAVTGSTVSPGIGETLEILGQSSTLARIDRCLSLV
jgi:glutamyl-tRNA synthetase